MTSMPGDEHDQLQRVARTMTVVSLFLAAACGGEARRDSCGVTQVWAANDNTCASTVDGRFWCWGDNGGMALGDGSTVSRSRPVEPVSLPRGPIVDATLSFANVCVVAEERPTCWGAASGADGETSVSTPVLRDEFRRPIRAIAVSFWWTCAIEADHTVWCRGDNARGMLGRGDVLSSVDPLQVQGLSAGIRTIAATPHDQTYALKEDGSVWLWGPDLPAEVTGLGGRTIEQIDLSNGQVCSLDSEGRIQCWGNVPTAGTEEIPFYAQPVELLDHGDRNERIAVGTYMICVLRTGSILCSGFGKRGELGDGRGVSHFALEAVTGLPAAVAQADAGERHVCARLVDETLWCWGANGAGQLGVGDTRDRFIPTQVMFPPCLSPPGS